MDKAKLDQLRKMDELVEKYKDEIGFEKGEDGIFRSQVHYKDRQILYALVREYKPKSVLEYGTRFGGCTYPILFALLKNKKKFTFFPAEISKDYRKGTKENIYRMFGKEFKVYGAVEENLSKMPKSFDFGFIDHDHKDKTTRFFLENILPKFKKNSLIAIHDWQVEDKKGQWVVIKSSLPENELLCSLHNKGKLPLEKFYWTFEGDKRLATGWFKKI